jgi:hypothetical protein
LFRLQELKMGNVSRYADEGQEIHGKPAGSVRRSVELEGEFAAPAAPQFKFDEAISCENHQRSTIFGNTEAENRLRLAEGQIRPVMAGRSAALTPVAGPGPRR